MSMGYTSCEAPWRFRGWRGSNLPALVAVLAVSATTALAAEDDPYAPLKLYDGTWNATTSNGKTTAIENHCARTGLFFACEQVVNGKPAALVVFLPRDRGAEGRVYLTQALTAAGDKPGAWRVLTIDGDHWVYSGAAKPRAKARRERTVNTFSGTDFIHFEVQSSTDGKTWTTTMSGDEHRVR